MEKHQKCNQFMTPIIKTCTKGNNAGKNFSVCPLCPDGANFHKWVKIEQQQQQQDNNAYYAQPAPVYHAQQPQPQQQQVQQQQQQPMNQNDLLQTVNNKVTTMNGRLNGIDQQFTYVHESLNKIMNLLILKNQQEENELTD